MSNKKRKRKKNISAQKRHTVQESGNIKNTNTKVSEESKSEILCAECEELLTDFMLGLLSEENARKIKLHLKACSQCQQAQQELEQIVGVLAHAEPVFPPPDFMKNLHRRLMKEQPIYLFIWNQLKYFVQKSYHIVSDYGTHFGKMVVQWWQSTLFPVLRSAVNRIGKMPKTWQIGAPVLACVFIVAVISTGIFTHMHSTLPGDAGNDQLAVSNNVMEKQKSNIDISDDAGQDDRLSQQQSMESSASPQGEKKPEDIAQDVSSAAESGEVSDMALAGNMPEENNTKENAPNISASIQVTDSQQSGGEAEGAESGAETVSGGGGNISAYSAEVYDEQPLSVASASGGGLGGARSAKEAPQIPTGTMDVYTIKTSNVSRTLANSGFAGKAINENGKTVLILTKSQYNQLQENLLSSKQTNIDDMEDIKYTGSESLSHSYEWDGCFRVEITHK